MHRPSPSTYTVRPYAFSYFLLLQYSPSNSDLDRLASPRTPPSPPVYECRSRNPRINCTCSVESCRRIIIIKLEARRPSLSRPCVSLAPSYITPLILLPLSLPHTPHTSLPTLTYLLTRTLVNANNEDNPRTHPPRLCRYLLRRCVRTERTCSPPCTGQ